METATANSTSALRSAVPRLDALIEQGETRPATGDEIMARRATGSLEGA